MSWTAPDPAGFETGDVLSEARLSQSVIQNLKHLGRGARVYSTVPTFVNPSTATRVEFWAERWDTDGFFDVTVNQFRLTVPEGADGRYKFGACGQFSGDPATGSAAIILNNTTTLVSNSFDEEVFYTGGTYDLAVGDFLTFVVTHTAGGALAVEVAGNYSPEFWIQGIGGS